MKTALVLSVLLALAALPLLPTASANHVCLDDVFCVHWDCVQVYPWSRLCQGDVVGFLHAWLGDMS